MTGPAQVAPRHRVVVLALPPVIGFDLTIAPEVFGQATGPDGASLYDVRVASLTGEPVPTPRGYAIAPEHDLGALTEADTIVIPGTRLPGPRSHGTLPPALREAFAVVPEGVRWVSICTGAFVLGAAGRLDGRRATTHWRYAGGFRELYPAVDLDIGVLFVDEGDVLTSAGLSAGLDLCLHIIRRDHGARTANEVARTLVVPPWRDGGQAQFIERPVPEPSDSSLADVRTWALDRLDEPLDVATMARAATMSLRTFARRFREETGESPAKWIAQQRLQRARELLESTDLPVEEVAARSGLGTGTTLRTLLRTSMGVSPRSYRRTFRGG